MASDHAKAMQRLESALSRLAAEQTRLRQNVQRYRGCLADLKGGVGRLEANLASFDRTLGTVRAGIDDIGAKSRALVSIMDGYLAGRSGATADPPTLPARGQARWCAA